MKYAELAKFLVEAPLYQPKHIEDAPTKARPEWVSDRLRAAEENGFLVPKELSERDCVNAKCRKATNWRWNGVPGSAEVIGLGLHWIGYRCMDCGQESLSIWIQIDAAAHYKKAATQINQNVARLAGKARGGIAPEHVTPPLRPAKGDGKPIESPLLVETVATRDTAADFHSSMWALPTHAPR